jgi:uncharacterized protein (UPF0305 family)
MKMATKQPSKKLTEYLERIQKSETVEMSFDVVLDSLRDVKMTDCERDKVKREHREKWFALHLAIKNLRRAQDRVNKLLNQPTQPTKENHGN